MKWEEYYLKCQTWSSSTMTSKLSELETFGTVDEIIWVAIAIDKEKGSTRLIKKAIENSITFNESDICELLDVLDSKVLGTLVLSTDTNFTTEQIEDISNYVDSSVMYELSNKMISNKTLTNSGQVIALIYAIEDTQKNSCIVNKALDMNIKFEPSDRLEVESFIDEDTYSRLILSFKDQLTIDDIEDSTPWLNEDTYKKLCKDVNGSKAFKNSKNLIHLLYELDERDASQLIRKALSNNVKFKKDEVFKILDYIDIKTADYMILTLNLQLSNSELDEIKDYISPHLYSILVANNSHKIRHKSGFFTELMSFFIHLFDHYSEKEIGKENLEKQMDAHGLREWEKELVRKGDYDMTSFITEDDNDVHHEEDYWYDDPNVVHDYDLHDKNDDENE